MGETEIRPFQLSFNSSLRVEFRGTRVTSDSGLILVRELDERPGLSALMERSQSCFGGGFAGEVRTIAYIRGWPTALL